MSSTRKAKDDSIFHQARYASSPEFERGLIANLVAKRCANLNNQADRELVWFIQYLSHQVGGLAAVAKDVIAKYADRIQTQAMAVIGGKPGKVYNTDQVRKILRDLPWEERCQFPLKGQVVGDDFSAEALLDSAGNHLVIDRDSPSSYSTIKFVELCRSEARQHLENYLMEICLDPALSVNADPWYFDGLAKTLREYQANYIKTKSAGVTATALGKKVCEVLDYTSFSRGLTLIQGEARLGKSFAANAWCEQHPGLARFFEVPPSNDETSFFRALARGLGLGNFLNYKAVQIRERVESVLLTTDILLVLDEAQRLWPQRNLREGFPSRIVWIMTMANAGVPICMVSTPQFFTSQKAFEKNGWNSAQLTGRISHYESLPADLSPEDLMAVAKAILPEAAAPVLRALAVYARSSARYLAAIDSIAKRARYIAMRAGRDTVTTDDVRRAMQESVIPADTKLHRALENGRQTKPGKLEAMTAMPPAPERLAQRDSEDLLPTGKRDGQIASAPCQRVLGASLIEA